MEINSYNKLNNMKIIIIYSCELSDILISSLRVSFFYHDNHKQYSISLIKQ